MGNILKKISKSTNLSLTNKNLSLYGNYRGFNVSISNITEIRGVPEFVIKFPMNIKTESQLNNLKIFEENLKREFKKLTYINYESYEIILKYSTNRLKYLKSEIIISILNNLVDFSINNNLVSCCNCCGEIKEVFPFLINKIVNSTCDNCQIEFKNSVSLKQEEIRNKKSNPYLGVIGSLLGASVGSLIWILIANLGYISVFSALALIGGTILGYTLFGGKFDISGLIINFIIVLIAVFFSNHAAFSYDLYKALKEYYYLSYYQVFNSAFSFLEEPALMDNYIYNLVIGLAVSMLSYFIYAIKKYKAYNYIIKSDKLDIK